VGDPFITEFSQYSCTDKLQRGPEHLYFFLAARSEKITIDVDDEGAVKANFLVLADAPEPGRCVKYDENIGQVTVQAGRAYYIVIDSREERDAGKYSLRLACK